MKANYLYLPGSNTNDTEIVAIVNINRVCLKPVQNEVRKKMEETMFRPIPSSHVSLK
jgi:hypothetical protein